MSPDQGQPFYQIARDHLQKLVVGKQVSFRIGGFVGSRMIGELQLSGVDLSQQMLRDGAAWHVPRERSGQDAPSFAVYESVASLAKQEKRGVWSVPDLKPAWQIRVEKDEQERIQEQTAWAESLGRSNSRTARASAKRTGKDVGALLAQYDERTKTGYVATPYFGVIGSENEYTKQLTLAVCFSYTYQDVVRKGKKATVGKWAMHIASMSDRWRFIKTNGVLGVADERTFALGRPKRINRTNSRFGTGEVWTYDISRAAIDKWVNSREAYLRSGNFLIIPTTGMQMMIYNLLQETK